MRNEAVCVAARLAHDEEVFLRYGENARHRFLRSEIEHRCVRVMRVTGRVVGQVVWLEGTEKPRPAWRGRESARKPLPDLDWED